MKKIITITTAIIITSSLSACTTENNADSDNNESSTISSTKLTQTGENPKIPGEQAKDKKDNEPDSTSKKEEGKSRAISGEQYAVAEVINNYIEITAGKNLDDKDLNIDYNEENMRKLAKSSGILELFDPESINEQVKTNLGMIIAETSLNHRISKEMLGKETSTEDFKQDPSKVIVNRDKATADNTVKLIKKNNNWYIEVPETLKENKNDTLKDLEDLKEVFNSEHTNK